MRSHRRPQLNGPAQSRLNLLAGGRSGQTSLRGRRKKAAWNDDYMLRIIASQTYA